MQNVFQKSEISSMNDFLPSIIFHQSQTTRRHVGALRVDFRVAAFGRVHTPIVVAPKFPVAGVESEWEKG